jgi:hypothetical protein
MRLDRDRARLDALNVRALTRHEEVTLSRARLGDAVWIKERGRRVFDTDITLARDLGRSAGLLDRRLVGERCGRGRAPQAGAARSDQGGSVARHAVITPCNRALASSHRASRPTQACKGFEPVLACPGTLVHPDRPHLAAAPALAFPPTRECSAPTLVQVKEVDVLPVELDASDRKQVSATPLRAQGRACLRRARLRLAADAVFSAAHHLASPLAHSLPAQLLAQLGVANAVPRGVTARAVRAILVYVAAKGAAPVAAAPAGGAPDPAPPARGRPRRRLGARRRRAHDRALRGRVGRGGAAGVEELRGAGAEWCLLSAHRPARAARGAARDAGRAPAALAALPAAAAGVPRRRARARRAAASGARPPAGGTRAAPRSRPAAPLGGAATRGPRARRPRGPRARGPRARTRSRARPRARRRPA